MRRIALTLAALAAPGLACAGLPFTGTYSNLQYTKSKDIVGMEVTLSMTGAGYFAVLQCSGPEPTRPVVVPVSVDTEKRTLAFGAHNDPDNECPMVAFDGKLTDKGLELNFPGDNFKDEVLKKKASFWD